MPDVLIYGDTMRSPELRHEVPVPIPDPFLYAEKSDRRIAILHSLEIPRVREDAPDLEIVPLEDLGSDELFTTGLQGWEVMLELAVRACRELEIERATVPESFRAFRSATRTISVRTESTSSSTATSSTTGAARRTRPSCVESETRRRRARRRSTRRASCCAARGRTAPDSRSTAIRSPANA